MPNYKIHLLSDSYNNDKEIKILDKDSRWFERGVPEAIQFRTKSLNRDQGQHQLTPTYNSVLSCDIGQSTSWVVTWLQLTISVDKALVYSRRKLNCFPI